MLAAIFTCSRMAAMPSPAGTSARSRRHRRSPVINLATDIKGTCLSFNRGASGLGSRAG